MSTEQAATDTTSPAATPSPGSPREALASRVARIVGPEADAPVTATAAPEGAGATAAPPTGAPDPDAEVRAKRIALFEEKLAKQREERKAGRLAEEASRLKKEAEADREAAAKERADLTEGKKNYKKFFEANGMNAEQAYRELYREMMEAGTPEAQIRSMQDAFKTQQDALKTELEAQVTPLKEELERLRAEKSQTDAHLHEQKLTQLYGHASTDETFLEVRAEYGDRDVFNLVRDWDKNPEALFEAAKSYGVSLANPGEGFTMREALSVIKAVYDQERTQREQRRARLIPPKTEPADQQPAKRPSTVNGTSERRNAGTTITNDLASSRASSGRRLSRQERVEELVRQVDKR